MLALAHSLLFTKLLPLVWAGLGFGLLITVHEFGHFLFCKLFGIGTPAFSIGFGPVLFSTRWWDCDFRLSLIPLGGYCAVEGMGEVEVVEIKGTKKTSKSSSFETKPYWQKFLVIMGGILFNIMFAYAAFTAIHIGSRPLLKTELKITQVVKDSAAAQFGLEKDHIITGYDAVTFSTKAQEIQPQMQAFLRSIAARPAEPITLHMHAPDCEPYTKEVVLGTKGKSGSLGIGIDLQGTPIPGQFEHDTFVSALRKGITMTHQWIAQTASGLVGMFKRRTLQGVGGPVAMFSQTFKMAKTGIRSFLTFLGIISISLAVINVLPLGALDGGQLLFITIEAIIRRPLPMKLKEAIIIASWLFFLGLVIFLSYHDIRRLIGR